MMVVGVVFVAIQVYTVFSVKRIEKQPYSVVEKRSGFEIRHYPSVKVARVNSTVSNYKAISSNGFRKLAGYIFGGNEKNQKIAMTSPVEMDINDSASSMQFVMPRIYATKELPVPLNKEVRIEDSEEEYVAAIEFGGFVNDKKLNIKKQELAALLQKENLKPSGSFRYLGYNPPYQLIGRKNEIIVRIERD